LSGAFYTGASELAIMNSNGIKEYFEETKSNLAVVATGIDTSGYSSASSRNVDDIDHVKLIEEALESAKTYGKTISVEPGEYPVILEEYAVAEMLIYLSWIAFNAEAVEEKISFVTPNKGEQLFPEMLNVHDDALSQDTFIMPMDYEGLPKTRVDFIKNGIVTGDVVNNYYQAMKNGIEPTGHGLPPSSGLSSSIAFHSAVDPGKDSADDLLSNMKKGIFIKRFHYLTTVHPLKTLLSGMTRDGIFWVENGKITARISNLRFTQSIIEALKNIKGMSRERKTIWFRDFSVEYPTSMVVPRMYIDKFNFTGKTEF
jgi:predicted Zn-dependent protease